MIEEMQFQTSTVDAVKAIPDLDVTIVNTKQQLTAEMKANEPIMILVFDAAIGSSKEGPPRTMIRDYVVKNGGFVIFCGFFSNFLDTYGFNRVFRETFALNWERGDYTRITHTVTKVGKQIAGMPASFNVKASMLSNVGADHQLYKSKEISSAAVALKRVGRGFVGFVGDVNAETETTNVLVVLCKWGLQTIPLLLLLEASDETAASAARVYSQSIESYKEVGDDEDMDEEEDEVDQMMANGGFTNDELNTLLSYGYKPWDLDARDFIRELRNQRM
ncbi:hypothetical protein HDU76_009252 [Blyttiomyces sp. JEL0837]|nr:hypothetical protein HDU76_009252 [Blyttiomyces sp. JEL0837]